MLKEELCRITQVSNVDTTLAVDEFVRSMSHKDKVLLDILRIYQEELHRVGIDEAA
jgi:hypothetical protein